jgi:hypothetical protein
MPLFSWFFSFSSVPAFSAGAVSCGFFSACFVDISALSSAELRMANVSKKTTNYRKECICNNFTIYVLICLKLFGIFETCRKWNVEISGFV